MGVEPESKDFFLKKSEISLKRCRNIYWRDKELPLTAKAYLSTFRLSGKHQAAQSLITKLRKYAPQLTQPAAGKIVTRLNQAQPRKPDLLRIAKIIDQGLANIAAKKPPTSEAMTAAEAMGLMFMVTDKEARLALKREVEELESAKKGARIIDADRIIAAHLEVQALHNACQAIRELMDKHPDLMGDEMKWAPKDPATGLFFAKTAFEGRTEEAPTAILPPLKMAVSVLIVGTEHAKGIYWPRSVLYKEVPYELSGLADYTFKAAGTSFIGYGEQTVEQALTNMGFEGPQRRPVMEIFAPVPAPSINARPHEMFVPRGLIELKSFEPGEYALITIIEDKAQKDVTGIANGEGNHVMGDQEMIDGIKQRTLLKFSYVPAMSESEEWAARKPQRGNIVVIAVPITREIQIEYSFLKSDSDTRKNTLPLLRAETEFGSTSIDRDRSTSSGISLGEKVRAVIDHSRRCGIFRIIPIGVSVKTAAQDLQATVINLADHRSG